MRVLRGTLTFVLGMIIGIILFVVAIGGTVVILATQMTVGGLQQTIIGSDSIISSDSEIYDKTILDAVKGVFNDVQNFDKLSLKTLYEHYGIKLLNGISGIDFTGKDFYSVPIPELVNDLSIIVNSFTLADVSKIAGVDFASYGLPVLTDNLDNNLKTAMDNILGSLNGDLSIRKINTNFGINLGVEGNALLGTLQDVVLSEFGNVMNVLRVSTILEADTDTFIPANSADVKYFKKVDVYEKISASELESTNCTLGMETSLLGGVDSDGDGKADQMKTVETRYVQKIDVYVDDNGETEVISYVADNSSYGEKFDFENNQKEFYRHKIYEPTQKTTGEDIYVLGYANRIETLDGTDYTLVEKGFISVNDLVVEDGSWAMVDDALDKNSKLALLDDGESATPAYKRVQEGKSTALLQTIAHMTISDLQNADDLLDGLTVSDVIEINDDSAKIMKSLAARNCKITELGTVANDLTLGEMIEIAAYKYEASDVGKYVRIEDESSYTLYDKTNPDYVGATRYKKNADGSFSPSDNGKFVRSVYYTLYNPAVHTANDRYNRKPLDDGESVSSAILQRFMGATLGGFSDAFDALMLADVMQIDADVYGEIAIADMPKDGTERYFYYDGELDVYRVANAEYIEDHPDETYYHVIHSGESTTFMKKLAYVKIDKMAKAMDAVIDDIVLSEFLDVYTEHAVELIDYDTISENEKYFIEYDKNKNGYEETVIVDGEEITNKYVYVYDSTGDIVKANYRPVHVDVSELDLTQQINYNYLKYSVVTGTEIEKATKFAQLLASGNIYYKPTAAEFKKNYALCIYMYTYKDSSGNYIYRDQIYYREKADGGAYSDPVYMSNDGKQLYIKDDFIGFLPYNGDNPAHAGMPFYTLEHSPSNNHSDYFFINRYDADLLAKAHDANPLLFLPDFDIYNTGGDKKIPYYYALRQCIEIYSLTTNTQDSYVYLDGQYVAYDPALHEDADQFFVKKTGYIGTISEVSINDGKETEFDLKQVKFIRERSVPVLRLLASGTIGEMTDIISNAKVCDIIESEPGGLFDMPEIKNAKITELGNVFSNILTTMTIGNLITWSKVTDMDSYVKTALNEVTIQSLLSSLELDKDTNQIRVNMLKLYGYEAA